MLSPSLKLPNPKPANLSLVASSRPHVVAAPSSAPVGQPRQTELLRGIGRDRLEKAHGTIKEITWRHSIYIDKTPREAGEVRQMFLRLAPLGMQVVAEQFHTLRRVHKLAWSLAHQEPGQPAISQTPFLELALDLIGRHYRNGMLTGLFDTLLKCWQSMAPGNRQKLAAFIAEKIKHYSGKRICVQNMSLHSHYYTCEDGAVALGERLCRTRGELPNVWQLLELPDHVKGYEYFSEAALAYLDLLLQEEIIDDGISDMIEFLGSHQKEDTIKKCLTRIVLTLESSWNFRLIDRVQVAALQLIGDPADESCWRPWTGAATDAISEFQGARQILKRWIAKRLVEYFYENFTQEDAKKRFWLSYTDHFSRVKIYCSRRIYDDMSRDEQMGPYVRSHFGMIRGAHGDEVALVLKVRSHVLIEAVTERSAFFACRAANPLSAGIDAGFIQLGDLHRLHDMEPLLQRQGENVIKHKQEGKITDGGLRSSFLTWWLRHHLGI